MFKVVTLSNPFSSPLHKCLEQKYQKVYKISESVVKGAVIISSIQFYIFYTRLYNLTFTWFK